MPGKIDLAYIAGFVDGEGAIMIKAYKSIFQLHVAVFNTNKDVLEWLKSLFNAKIYAAPTKEGNKQCWKWVTYDANAEKFLRAIYPFLKLKKLQAETAFAFRKTFDEHYQRKGVPVEVVEKRKMIRLQMKQLNKKGIT